MALISCIVTDDETFARKGIAGYIQKTGLFELKGQCEDAVQLGKMIAEQPVDLLFLDIGMPQVNGVDFIRSLTHPPKVIFTTAFKEYASDGFDLDVLDYLLKPVSYERFMKAALKARDYFALRNNLYPAYIFVKADGKLEKLVFEEILFVQGMENYVIVQTISKKIITHSTLRAFAEKLPVGKYLQTHKSYLVAIDKVSAIDGNTLLVDQFQVPISRLLKDQVIQALMPSK